MVKHPWPLLEISLSDFRRLPTLNIYTYIPRNQTPSVCLLALFACVTIVNMLLVCYDVNASGKRNYVIS